ncbi:MAG TPA: CDF family Co(II)/Ni(II) efflux transporter DmeF [Tepidisphaeraceae bacterium]|nr:CDF family Co(II)/Ni(II) efflux transporter DmeF [Tepidisphaeraceae bacterium]
MPEKSIAAWQHDHVFGQDRVRPGERRTLIVIVVTAAMMIVEIAAGILFGSMALLADGLHMGSHATALGIAVYAYIYARRHAHDRNFTFGTGKVNALGGFAGAVLLAVFALMMAYESLYRLIQPVPIGFNQAILVAIIGLVVNGVCVVILDEHRADHHDHAYEPSPEEHAPAHHDHAHAHSHSHDHNLQSAYLHVLADALTSVTAIAALITGKYLGWTWMDPLMGVVGSLVVAQWSWGLVRTASAVLLDRQASQPMLEEITACLESRPGVKVADLHVWSIGPSIHAAAISILAAEPATPDQYKALLPEDLNLVHVTIEVQQGSTIPRAAWAERTLTSPSSPR